MILKGWIPALGFFVLAVTWSGCLTDQLPPQYTCVDDVIRIGDTLTISLLDIPEPKTDSFLVGSDGTVNLSLLGPVVATNKSFGAFEKEIQTSYLDKKFYKKVTVVVRPGDRFYTVGGEVNAKGRMMYVGQTTVLRAIVTCGDFTEFANRKKVEILRANGTREVMDCVKARRDQRYDRPLCPGDAVFVPSSL